MLHLKVAAISLNVQQLHHQSVQSQLFQFLYGSRRVSCATLLFLAFPITRIPLICFHLMDTILTKVAINPLFSLDNQLGGGRNSLSHHP